MIPNKCKVMVFSRVALLIFLSFLLLISFTNSQLTPLYHQCSKLQGNHTPSSTYNSNLKNLLSSLISNTDIDYGFYNFSLGQGSDKVYAVGLCRGDINPTSCRSCIRMSTDQLTKLCSSQNEATIVYDNCTLRYSNRSIFRDTFSSEPYFSEYDSSKVPDVEQFSEAVRSLLFRIRDKAPLGSSLRKFATGKADFGNSGTIYALTQCTPDLAYYDCYNCLESAVTYYPNFIGNPAGRIYFPSCYARYDTIQFYETASDAPPAPATNLSPPASSGSTTKGMILRIILPTIGFVLISCTFCCCLVSHKRNKKNKTTANKEIATDQSLQFELETIEAATNRFSDDDKIGVGGFGNVYKGTLPNGQKIAVKRLSRSSGQGVQEFKNEVELVAKLQHRNLVRLLGFCLERNEKILIYEFVSNKSLDNLLFDLCVQEDPAARPTMGKVVSMLISSSVRLPLPQQPAFYVGSRTGSNLGRRFMSTVISFKWWRSQLLHNLQYAEAHELSLSYHPGTRFRDRDCCHSTALA